MLSNNKIKSYAYRLERAFFVAVCCSFTLVLGPSLVGVQAQRDTIDVLFVGNSYVYYSDLLPSGARPNGCIDVRSDPMQC